MNSSIKIGLFTLALAGCASVPTPALRGNFIEGETRARTAVMAEDVVLKLNGLYPPAHTRFRLQQQTPDDFGAALVAALRMKGYAIVELPAASANTKAIPLPLSGDSSGAIPLAYIVDEPLDPGLYRMTVMLGSQSLSRLYQSRDGVLAPAGTWIRKE